MLASIADIDAPEVSPGVEGVERGITHHSYRLIPHTLATHPEHPIMSAVQPSHNVHDALTLRHHIADR